MVGFKLADLEAFVQNENNNRAIANHLSMKFSRRNTFLELDMRRYRSTGLILFALPTLYLVGSPAVYYYQAKESSDKRDL